MKGQSNSKCLEEGPVTFTVAEEQLIGMWHAAQAPFEAAPAVVLCHGFTGHKAENHRIFVDLARHLAAHGIGVLRFDCRGSGDSAGAFQDMTVSREVADTMAALDYVRGRPDVDPQYVALVGFSLGGLVATLAAAQQPALRALVLWNPVADTQRLVTTYVPEEERARLDEPGMVHDHNGWAVGGRYYNELLTLRPLETAAVAGTTPVLVVTGSEDGVVPATEGEAYVDAWRTAGRDVTHHPVREAGHTFATLHHRKEAIEVTAVWLSLCLGYRGE